jgi:hypothetical protein
MIGDPDAQQIFKSEQRDSHDLENLQASANRIVEIGQGAYAEVREGSKNQQLNKDVERPASARIR